MLYLAAAIKEPKCMPTSCNHSRTFLKSRLSLKESELQKFDRNVNPQYPPNFHRQISEKTSSSGGAWRKSVSACLAIPYPNEINLMDRRSIMIFLSILDEFSEHHPRGVFQLRLVLDRQNI